MAEPVLVVHGVATRDRDGFVDSVKSIEARAGADWRLIPVFWGDLGAKLDFLPDSIPELPGGVRGVDGELDPALADAIMRAMLAGGGGDAGVRSEAPEEIVLGAAEAVKGASPSAAVRGEAGTDALAEAVRDEWPNTTYLRHLNDPALLEAIGRALGTAVRDSAPDSGPGDSGDSLVRGGGPGDLLLGDSDGMDTRGLRDHLRNLSKSVLHELDRVVGATLSHTLGNFNQNFRSAIAVPVGLFLGDVFAYQRNQREIQSRLTQALKEHAPGYGTEQKPVFVIAHSLGGVLTLDMATRPENPLWIESLITFGSQSAFFHLLDPRDEALSVYSPGQPVKLPRSVGRWTNLWHPLDPLAFLAGKVYRLHDGTLPEDRQTTHLASQGLNTHGSYWTSSDLVKAITEKLV